MEHPAPNFRLRPRHLIIIGVLALALYVIVPQVGGFRESWGLLRQPHPGWTALVVALTALTYVSGAATYCLLAFRRLRFGRTLLVQLAAMFVNRLLPTGSGSLGVNYFYLRHSRHPAAQAAAMLTANNLLGFAGHALLVFVTLVVTGGQTLPARTGYDDTFITALQIASAIFALVLMAAAIFGHRRLRKLLTDTTHQFLGYRRRPGRLAAALCTSVTLTLLHVLALGCCLLALDVHLPFVTILLIFTFGVGASVAAPTPGGLGSFEAGLVAGLLTAGVASPLALAAALLYRLITYWLPLTAGVIAFLLTQRRHLLDPPENSPAE